MSKQVNINSLAHTTWNCKYHIVFAPKYRRKVFFGQKRLEIGAILRSLCEWKEVEIIEAEVCPDHVHILMEVDPQFGIHKAVKSLKGYTSKILRQEFPYLRTKMPTLWTNSYFVSTVGGAPLEVIKQYIENQKTSQRQKDKLG